MKNLYLSFREDNLRQKEQIRQGNKTCASSWWLWFFFACEPSQQWLGCQFTDGLKWVLLPFIFNKTLPGQLFSPEIIRRKQKTDYWSNFTCLSGGNHGWWFTAVWKFFRFWCLLSFPSFSTLDLPFFKVDSYVPSVFICSTSSLLLYIFSSVFECFLFWLIFGRTFAHQNECSNCFVESHHCWDAPRSFKSLMSTNRFRDVFIQKKETCSRP